MRHTTLSRFQEVMPSWGGAVLLSTFSLVLGLAPARSTGLAFSSARISGTNLVVSGSGRSAGATYYISRQQI